MPLYANAYKINYKTFYVSFDVTTTQDSKNWKINNRKLYFIMQQHSVQCLNMQNMRNVK